MLIGLQNEYWVKGQQIRAHGSCLQDAGLGIIVFIHISVVLGENSAKNLMLIIYTVKGYGSIGLY